FGVDAMADASGYALASRYRTMFGEVLASSGGPLLSPGYLDMDVLSEPDAPNVIGLSARGAATGAPSDVAYLSRTGTLLSDLGLGPDVMGQIQWQEKSRDQDQDGCGGCYRPPLPDSVLSMLLRLQDQPHWPREPDPNANPNPVGGIYWDNLGAVL